jgi:CHAT domain-containing protein
VLTPDEVLVEYLVAPERLVVLVVTRGGVRAVVRPLTAERLAARIRVARDLLGSPHSSPDDVTPVLGALFEDLIAPVADSLLGVTRLLVVPHGVLTYVPFAALRDPVSGRYLVESHAIVVLPSAAALAAMRRRSPVPERLTGIAFAPQPEALPASREEARAVQNALAAGRAGIGRRAREADVRRALAEAGVVHLAAHGVLSAASPLFSRIELSRGGSRADSRDDGRLEVHEVLGLRIASRLVFLSGCETGLGTGVTAFEPGEDFATLARAFLHAGARDVVATLWRVEDAAAAAFAGAFYRHLRAVPPAEALVAAQRELLGRGPFEAPYHWAGYMLSGAGASVNRAQAAATMSVESGIGGSSP